MLRIITTIFTDKYMDKLLPILIKKNEWVLKFSLQLDIKYCEER